MICNSVCGPVVGVGANESTVSAALDGRSVTLPCSLLTFNQPSVTSLDPACSAKAPGQHQCLMCSQHFSDIFTLRRHMIRKHPEADVDALFPLKKHRLRRSVDKQQESMLTCSVCSKVFSSRSYLSLHSRRLHGLQMKSKIPGKYQCQICSTHFSVLSAVRRHMIRKHPEADVDALCPLKKHRLHRSVDKQQESMLTCSVCSKVFSSRSYLRLHSHRMHGMPMKSKIPGKYQCQICSKHFSVLSAVRRHMIRKHPEADVDALCILKKRKMHEIHGVQMESKTRCQCQICSRHFSKFSVVRRHMIRMHPEADVDALCPLKKHRLHRSVDKQESMLTCSVCSKGFSSQPSLRLHSRRMHGLPPKRRCVTLSCPSCPQCLSDFNTSTSGMTGLVDHMNTVHDHGITTEQLTFETEEDFDTWRTGIEKETPCSFIVRHSKARRKLVYCCSRSGRSRYQGKPVGVLKRHPRVNGPSRIGHTCPAHIVADKSVDNGTVAVTYVGKHLCHTNRYEQLGHLRLCKKDRSWIAAKLSLKIPAAEILREARKFISVDSQLDRLHLLTMRDILNVQRDFGLGRPERADANDSTSVETWVRSFDGHADSPIILYKRQGSTMFDTHPEIALPICQQNDFLLAIMLSSSRDMLLKYGVGNKSVVCVDSTHGTNAYDIHLSTLMVLDSSRQGYPVAFLFSSRETEDTFQVFFDAVKAKCGCPVQTNTFMSDMAPQLYSAWSRVMGAPPHRLHCSWHVDQAVQKKTKELIKDAEERKAVYKTFRTLMEESDVVTFEAMLPAFLGSLHNPATEEFSKYFETHYAKNANTWAYCYRAGCGINTNMHLERMHGILKYKYLRGKKTKRMDSAIKAVLDLAFDREYDRLISLCKGGKVTKKLSLLRRKHFSSLGPADVIPTSESNSWLVRSESDDVQFYDVRLVIPACSSCDLRCMYCDACLHMYQCSCPDYSVRFNMCKHIHAVCKLLKAAHVEAETSETLVVDESQAWREIEANLHIEELGRSCISKSGNKEECRTLLSQLALYLNDGEGDNEEEAAVIAEGLRVIKAKLAALSRLRLVNLWLVQAVFMH